MDMNFENPFADYSTIVHGDRFIGRHEHLKVIENRILRPKRPGNLAIIGQPQIGKSSLVYKGIIDAKAALIAKAVLPIHINLATYNRSSELFRSLVAKCIKAMKELNWDSTAIQRGAANVLDAEFSLNEGYEDVQDFFRKVRQEGHQILFILDEFDHARHLFQEDIASFQRLRDLSDEPECRVNYVVISRRDIRDIELQSGSISTFAAIFQKHYLGMFSDKDLEEYFHRLASIGATISSDIIEQVHFYCSGHPYLSEMLGYHCVEIFREQRRVDVKAAYAIVQQSFEDLYDHIVELLREDDKLKKLLQILFGPVVEATQFDADKFQKYNLIKPGSEGYAGFSEHFHTFLGLLERHVDLWNLWTDAEKALRSLITIVMLKQFGDDWMAKLEKTHSHIKTIFESCRETQKREKKSFGSRASQDLLDFTYPDDLFAIIFKEWGQFKPILGKDNRDKTYWQKRAEFLKKVRTPLAHNRDVLSDHERTTAEGYCKEIKVLVGSL